MPFNFFKKDADKDKKDAKNPADPAVPAAAPLPVVVPPPVPTVVIFDFDGVLADSLKHLLDTLNKFSEEKKLGIKLANYKDVVDIQSNVKVSNMGKLLANFNELKATVLNGFAEKITDTQLYQGLKDALLAMREAGYIVGIVCANRAATVQKFLELHNIEAYFHFIKASEGPDKMGLMKAVIKEYKAVKERTFYVTGRVSYVPDVKKIATAVGTCWGGFDQTKDFTSVKAHSVVNHPHELVALIGNTAVNAPVIQAEQPAAAIQAVAVVPAEQAENDPKPVDTAVGAPAHQQDDTMIAANPSLSLR